MGIVDGFDAVQQLTDQRRWDMAMDLIRQRYQGSGILKEYSEDFEDIETIHMFEATESLNFTAGANRYAWVSFTNVDDETLKANLKEVIERLNVDDGRFELMLQHDHLMAELKASRTLTPGLHDAVKRYIAENGTRQCKYLRVPILFQFEVGERPWLPRYARHFRKFHSKIGGSCRGAGKVIGEVFDILRQTFGNKALIDTGDASVDAFYQMAALRGEWIDYPPPLCLAADGTAAAFYRLQRRELMNSKLPPIMLVLSAAKGKGFIIPAPACTEIFAFLPRVVSAKA
mmetsp:Transcript_74161/g.239841  ORF Transcript_74161/g.239841 Transcript_74161/m.239841 type:complete len:287 (+) Transcript_74161:79-939(+)